MANVKLGSAGVTAREIDLTGPQTAQPVGVPAGIIGTALKGPAFVPVTVAIKEDFYAKFGKTDGKKFGPLGAVEWLRNSQSLTYLRVLGIGDGKKRNSGGTNAGNVTNAGFVVGELQPHPDSGILTQNPYANYGGAMGRTYFLGAVHSASAGSTYFEDAGLLSPGQELGVPLVRGILMTPSGVVAKLSSSFNAVSSDPGANFIASTGNERGSIMGTVTLYTGATNKQDFVMLLNGHKGTDSRYPRVYTGSFDSSAPNYFPNVFNRDPYKLQEAGHYLYASYDVSPALGYITGTNFIQATFCASNQQGREEAAFLTTGSLGRNVGSATTPNFENFEDRFRHAKSPWVVSQKFGGKAKNLFRFHSLDAGAGVADQVKISIENIAQSDDTKDKYGTFDVVIRDWNDTDANVRAIESFRGCSLNPSSDRYIAKLIGDLNVYFDFDRSETSQKVVVDGNYPNKSNYIRVELDSGVENEEVDATALPIGYRGLAHLVTSGSATLNEADSNVLAAAGTLYKAVQPPVPMRQHLKSGEGVKASVDPSLYWGVQLEKVPGVTIPNGTLVKDDSVKSFTKYFPDFMTSYQNMIEDYAVGESVLSGQGVLDVDVFNNNGFSLEKLQVVTGSTAKADPQKWVEAVYVRNGNISADDTNKTRGFTVADLTQPNRRFAKYTLLMQGGFDGVNSFNEAEATISDVAVTQDMDDTNRGQTSGPSVKAYTKALEVMKNKTDVDVQILATPGIRHSAVTDQGIATVEERFDALYLMDIPEMDTLDTNVTSSVQIPSVTNTAAEFKSRALNSSFGAAYYPDVVITDPNTGTNVLAPPSVAMLGAIAYNDAVAYPWYAPAGTVRGALSTTLEAKVKLSKPNMDTLADANINPLVAFPGDSPAGSQAQGGVVAYGQRTLQAFASSLDRVNVRRLLISIRRDVRDASNQIIFEPNRESTLAKFQAAVEPILARVQRKNGVKKYKVQIDASTTTELDIQNNTIKGKIVLQPVKSIETVSLDFVVSNKGIAQ